MRRELRTCPVDGHTVLLNDVLTSVPERTTPLPSPPVGDRGWHHHDPPWVGVEGNAAVQRVPAVSRDALGAHEWLAGDLPTALRTAQGRMTDLRGDTRLKGFGVAGVAVDGAITGLDLVALPFETRSSAPAGWRDAEVGGPRCIAVAEAAVALLAWAPRTPLECWVLPREGRASFGYADPASVAALAEDVLSRLARALPGAAIEVVLVDGEPWRLELRPRMTTAGVFTAATGLAAHGSFPERAALYLRDLTRAVAPATRR